MTTTVDYGPTPLPRRIKVSVGAGDTPVAIKLTPASGDSRFDSLGDYVIVAAIPGGGGSMLVEATWSQESAVDAGTANWFQWDAGTVTAATNQRLEKATAIRFTATTAAGVGEVAR